MTSEAVDSSVGGPLWVDIEEPTEEVLRQFTAAAGSGESQLVIPSSASDRAVPRAGAALMLRWSGGRGVCSCAAVMVAVQPGAPKPAWKVRIVGSLENRQRREYARASFVAPVLVVPVEDGLVQVVKGELTDLSEGGLRARLRGALTPGGGVEVHLDLDGASALLSGTVLRSDPDVVERGIYESVVAFAINESQATRLRRMVFRQQVLARQKRDH